MSENLERLKAEVESLDERRRSLRPTSDEPLAVERWRRAEARFEDALRSYKIARWNRLSA